MGISMEAQKEMLSQIKEKRPVVFVLDAQSNYYIYHWILTHDYVYCKDDDALYPRELFAKIYPGQAGDDYRAVTGELDLGRICASLGNSMKSLQKCFTAKLALPSVVRFPAVSTIICICRCLLPTFWQVIHKRLTCRSAIKVMTHMSAI